MSIRKLFLVIFLFGVLTTPAQASFMDYVSDLISTSAPSAAATHRIRFTLIQAIPASGRIVLTPEAGAFTVPSGFDYGDVDFAVWDGASYVDRTLAASPSAGADGVSVVTGTSSAITITLSSSAGLLAGDRVELRFGTNATVGVAGDTSIINPANVRSYHIEIRSYTNTNTLLDKASPMIAVIYPVNLEMPLENTPPGISNAFPSGLLAAGSANIELSFDTDRTATCRYSATSSLPYDSMDHTFTSVARVFFYTVIGGHVDNTSYTYYVRCKGIQGAISDEFPISFTLAETPPYNNSVENTGAQRGSGDFPNGSSVLFQSQVVLTGFTSPAATIVALKDGKQMGTTQAKTDGTFTAVMGNLERGTYTFSTYAIDSNLQKTGSYSAVLSIGAATNNIISGIILPPSVSLEKESIAPGDSVRVFGEAAPGASIEISVKSSTVNKTFTASTTVQNGINTGVWSFVLPGSALQLGTYTIKVRANFPDTQSDFGSPLILEVGQSSSLNSKNPSDINKDGKVNLVDFSILLSFWGTNNAAADINADTTINLADFSIMLFNWTG